MDLTRRRLVLKEEMTGYGHNTDRVIDVLYVFIYSSIFWASPFSGRPSIFSVLLRDSCLAPGTLASIHTTFFRKKKCARSIFCLRKEPNSIVFFSFLKIRKPDCYLTSSCPISLHSWCPFRWKMLMTKSLLPVPHRLIKERQTREKKGEKKNQM